ncbi:hypothetical protein GGX14DRAFT_561837 [Mycena pura]|uniref:Uncharacterized protein n=1 Tax=Mycena pura TaxID=153505 RepID=A0AAD6VMD7_9AGAR|nr:hypothetical protein GGX14DRAFT_561837 [Mycena pura]
MPAHRHAPSLDHENSCSECQRYLIIKFAIGGQSAGHFYIQCNKCKFFYAFPRRDAPPTVAHVPPPPNYVLPSLARPASQSSSRHSTPSSSQASRPLQVLGKRKSSDGSLCAATSQRCGRKASPTCAYSRCKTHCIVEKTGCLAVGHQREWLTDRQRQKHRVYAPSRRTPTPPPPPSLHLPSLSPHSNHVLNTATRLYELPSIPLQRDTMADFLQNDAYHEHMDDLAQDEELRQLLGSPALSTSAVTNEERDEANLALGIALSKCHAEAASTLAMLSSSACYPRRR